MVETARAWSLVTLTQDLSPAASQANGVAAWWRELARGVGMGVDGATVDAAAAAQAGAELRPRVAALLKRLQREVEPKLTDGLARASRAWDQADALILIDAELARDIAAVTQTLVSAAQTPARASAGARRHAEAEQRADKKMHADKDRDLATDASLPRAAVALEALLVIDTAVSLVRLFESRLASLLRLRRRSATPDLLPEGRPFLDLAGALGELAEAWR